MADIYTINSWASSTVYNKNDIVQNNSLYYYATVRHTSVASFSTDLSAGKWDGQLTYNGESRPYFWWKLSYNYSLEIKPAVKKIQFGDSYIQETADGINNILLPFNISFDERDLAEYTAILHFLHTQNGVTKFFFIPPQPYGVVKKFVCPQWSPSQSFYDNYSIKATFEERV